MDDQKYCPQCGAANSPDAVFCDCGNLFSGTSPLPPPDTPPASTPLGSPPYTPPSRQQRRFKKRYVLYGVIALFLLSIVAVAVSPSQPAHTTSTAVPTQHASVVELSKTGLKPAAYMPKRIHKTTPHSATIRSPSTAASSAQISANAQQGVFTSNTPFVQPDTGNTVVALNAPVAGISYPYESVGNPFNSKLVDSNNQGYSPWLDSLGSGGSISLNHPHPGNNVSGQVPSQINQNTDLNQNANKLIQSDYGNDLTIAA